MGTIQLGYLLICAGRGDDFGGHTRTLPVALGPVRGARTQHASLAAAHLVQALAQIVTI